jgi:N-acetylgalactosamine kinase
MSRRVPQYSMILAAGKGTRMGSVTRHKVCFPVDGQPVIHRTLDIYEGCGIRQHILVVGFLADQVIETVGRRHENVIYTYQADPLGTAHAARQGLKALDGIEGDADVLLVAGDRIIDPEILKRLFDLYYHRNADLALLAVPRRIDSNQGRLVTDDRGRILGVVEAADIRQRRVFRSLRHLCRQSLPLQQPQLLKMIRDGFAGKGKMPGDTKFEAAFGDLWRIASDKRRDFSMDDIRFSVPENRTRFEFADNDHRSLQKTPDAVDASPWLNTSVYLIRVSALRFALSKLDRENAQQEEYLSDIVGVLALARKDGKPGYVVEYLPVEDSDNVLGFNNPAELLQIENLFQSKKEKPPIETTLPKAVFRTVDQWTDAFEGLLGQGRSADTALWDELCDLYSRDTEVIQERLEAYIEALTSAAGFIGGRSRVFIVRVPGRVNVMSRHIDHQGGICNLMTIGYETLMVVRPRTDDHIKLFSTAPELFPEREFSIGKLVEDLPWDDWLSLVNSEKMTRIVHQYGGDWAQYIKAAVLRLQKRFRTKKLCGMEIVVSGNIPIAAGLSSSSSLVVGAAEAAIAINQLETHPVQLVDLCGEGEWFVGTRGGAADHAAIKLGQKGKVVKVTFFDFRVLETVPFPKEYVLVVCESGVKSQKTVDARDLFNHRICCYRIGFLLIKKFLPQYRAVLYHLRDVNVRNLDRPLTYIYRLLLRLPESATRSQLRELLPDQDIDIYLKQHTPPPDGLYPIRGVVLFGLAEMERAGLFADAIKSGRMGTIGRMMNVSHDGDRVISVDRNGTETPYRAPASDDYLSGLIRDLESKDPERADRAQLQWQPGSYRCSLSQIDRMVDISLKTDGVFGAQLAGAGLGGCMMVLSRREAVHDLEVNLTEGYYDKIKKKPSILICRPVAGSGVLGANGFK